MTFKSVDLHLSVGQKCRLNRELSVHMGSLVPRLSSGAWLSLGKSQPLQLMLLSSHFSPSERESMKPCDGLTGRKTIAYGAVDLDGASANRSWTQ